MGLVDLETTLTHFSKEIRNPYRKSTQFYSGESKIRVPAGEVEVRVFKVVAETWLRNSELHPL